MSIFQGKKILITAGPTYEPIDPVRFIGNRSSGKMGYALAEQLASRGADVVLVSGPVNITINHKKIELIKVETAQEMFDACVKHFKQIDIAIMAAAVADYTIKNPSAIKIKKQDNTLNLVLEKTKDILKHLGSIKNDNQLLVGFALETNNEEANAFGKLKSKNADFIVLNSLQDVGAGFQHDTNKITIVDKYNKITKFELKNKTEVAVDIIDFLKNFI
jgi:phosphopantothenoylcysteine decarboxylase/phosphopantothenate--cysteine ligase